MKNLKSPKCRCGKTKNPNGNCDGSHANTRSTFFKTTVALLAILLSVTFQSFTTNDNVKVKKSTVEWKGEKVVGSHEGTISLKSADLIYEKKKLKGGNFIMDMSTIVCTDLSGDYKNNLEGHLKSDDFFGVEKFPTASLNIKKVDKIKGDQYKISAKLTIKGISKTIEFTAVEKSNSFNAIIKIDRTDFNINYGSGSFFDNLGDKMIYDEFEIKVSLEI
jgi:polyisoprenoid-binding protein YceI